MERTLHDFVLLTECEKTEQTTAGGIVLPGGANESNFHLAKVVQTGAGRRTMDGTLVEVSVKPGDVVYVTKEACRIVFHAGTKYLIAREEAIPCVVECGK